MPRRMTSTCIFTFAMIDVDQFFQEGRHGTAAMVINVVYVSLTTIRRRKQVHETYYKGDVVVTADTITERRNS